MIRNFREHIRRQVISLDGTWDFNYLDNMMANDVRDVTRLTYDDRMMVPGCFDVVPRYAGQRGLAAYRTQINVREGDTYRLVFGAVNHWCRVLLNGMLIRDHRNGFTRFQTRAATLPPGDYDLVLLVDNRINPKQAALHLDYYDWYHYGGIIRGVELHRLGQIWIDSLRVITDDYESRRISVDLRYDSNTRVGMVPLSIQVDGEPVVEETVELTNLAGSLVRSFELPGAALWSPDAPNLHRIEVRLGNDDQIERFGIRQVEVRGREILINGEAQRLLGVNRHEMHPDTGFSTPTAVMRTDLDLLKAMGGNFVRGSHYPQDPRFLDLCDEMGFMVWVEATGWQNTPDQLKKEQFRSDMRTVMAEMVEDSANHPSIIMWGLLNEGTDNDPKSVPAYKNFINHLRKLDPTRPITFASNHPYDSECLNLADIVSVNLYPGWYGGELDDIAPILDGLVAHLDGEGGQADKPLIISEIGAGAVPGWRDRNQARWSEEYQVKLLQTVIDHLFVQRDRAAGLAIWQYCDVRASDKVERMLTRPRGFNNKGVVDEYRRPKLAFDAVAAAFKALAT